MKYKLIKKLFLLSFLFFVFLNISAPVLAKDEETISLKIPIGNLSKLLINESTIGLYIMEIYKYLIGIVGILATVVMMIGGVIWISAGGNASRVGEAKAWIGGALMGLVLALSSYTILNTIDPDLVSIQKINIAPIEAMGCCMIDKKAYFKHKKDCPEPNIWKKNQKPNYDDTKCIEYDAINTPGIDGLSDSPEFLTTE